MFNHPVNIIAAALQKQNKSLPVLPCEPVTAICAITGIKQECIPRKEVISYTFTNLDIFRAPDSRFIGVDFFYSWNYGYPTGHTRDKHPERSSSWFCDGNEFLELNRQGIRDWVLKKEMPEAWTGYVTTSYKKHGSMVAKVNTKKRRVWAFEMRTVDCTNFSLMLNWWQTLNTVLRAGIVRSILESLECPAIVLKNLDIKKWVEFEKWARPKYQSALYAFLCYLLPSQDELKEEQKNAMPI
jgi:hypothetical protein